MVHLGARTVGVRPAALRARGRVFLAVRDALAAAPGTAIPLQVIVNENAIRGWVNTRAKFFRRAPVSTRAVLSGLTPHLTKPKDGRELMTYYGRRKVVAALRSHDRDVTMPCADAEADPHPVEPRAGRRHPARLEAPRALPRHQGGGDERGGVVRGGDRDGRLPDADRQLPHRHEAAESLVVSAGRRLGARRHSPSRPAPGTRSGPAGWA